MKKSWLIRGHTLALLFALVLIFSLAIMLIAPVKSASAATVINNQITALNTTAGLGPRSVITQSEKNFKFYEVVIAAAAIALGPGPGQKSDTDLLAAKANTFYKKADLSLQAPLITYGLKNDTAVYIADSHGYHIKTC